MKRKGDITNTQVARKVGRIGAIALLPVLFVIAFVTCADIASAQTPPDQVKAAALGPSAVQVTFIACQSSEEDNCNYGFSIYRNPPGLSQLLVGNVPLGYGTYPGSSTTIWMDKTVKGGTSYTYRVCTGAAKSDGSNCTTTTPVLVPVGPPPTPKPTVTLKAASTSLLQGQQTELSWTSTDATELKLDPGHQNVAIPSGSTSVGPGTYTITATNAVGQVQASVSINVTCPTPWAPPTKVSALVGSNISLTWTNPSTSPDQWCPGPSSKVLIYRMGTSGYQQLAELDKTSNGALPNRYTDSGPFQPHTGYFYEVCEGAAPNWQNPNNCFSLSGVDHDGQGFGTVTGGAAPVLKATRANANTVKLQLSLDQYGITSVVVTRQGSDDPCRQGGTLGDGLQGCTTTKIGPGGVPVSPASTVTVFSWTQSPQSGYPPGWVNTQTAPFVVNLPDDTAVKPGVEYYYLAQVTWLWSVEQDSQTVTAPKNSYGSVSLQQSLANGSMPVKQNGNAPPPPSGSAPAASSPMARTIPPASQTIAPQSSAAGALKPEFVQLLSHNVKGSPKIMAPGMADGSDSALVGLLRQQAQAAQSILAERKAGEAPAAQAGSAGGSGGEVALNPQPLPPRTITGNSTPQIGAEHTMSASGGTNKPATAQPTATMANPAPSGPTKQQPPGHQQPNPLAKEARAPQPTALCLDGIASVDGWKTGTPVIFSPMQLMDNYQSTTYVIQGCGFGTKPGEVYLTGIQYSPSGPTEIRAGGLTKVRMNSSQLGLEVSANAWTDKQISATVDPNTSGYYNADSVTLVVKTADGKQYQAAGFKFRAAKAPQQLSSIPLSSVTLAQVTDSSGHTVQAHAFSPSAGSVVLPGHTFAVVRDDNGATFSGGTDTINLNQTLQSLGFYVSSIQFYRADLTASGCQSIPPGGGKFTTNASWNVSQNGGGAQIQWEEQSCATASTNGTNATDIGSVSAYALDITVTGPRGVSPWANQ
ncbi:MAG TPA: hypothetical protein VLY23_12965 [Candidatus Acidoferrum sp.]|nr:hypothetical protein [Candidatus Acidoferrum sp.]